MTTAEAKLLTREILLGFWNQAEYAQAEMDGAWRVAENTAIQLAAASVIEQQSRARYDAGLAPITDVAESQRLLSGDVREVLGNLRAGDDVVRRGNDEIRPGTKVTPTAPKN